MIGVALFRRKPEPQPIPGAAVGRGDGFAGPTAEAIRDRAATASENRKQPSTAESVGETGEPRVPQSLASTPLSTPLGTGHGRSENSPARNVTFERATSQAEEVITLYYESHANLLARGIVVAPPVVRPVPRPFPGHFVPDPPRG